MPFGHIHFHLFFSLFQPMGFFFLGMLHFFFFTSSSMSDYFLLCIIHSSIPLSIYATTRERLVVICGNVFIAYSVKFKLSCVTLTHAYTYTSVCKLWYIFPTGSIKIHMGTFTSNKRININNPLVVGKDDVPDIIKAHGKTLHKVIRVK